MEIWCILQMFGKDRWSFQKSSTGIWSFRYHEERWHFFFPKIWYFFNDGYISQKIHGNIMFSVLYVDKGGISFSYKYEITLLSKKKRWSFRKNTPKDDISGIIEKDDIHPRKDDLGILCTFTETFLSVFIYCFPIKKPRKLNL